MYRYQIVYSKHGTPLTIWMDDPNKAKKFTDELRTAGYIVDVWVHSRTGAKKIDL